MIYRVFSIFDAKAAAFMLPFYQPTVGMALRVFGDNCNQPDTMFYKHPEDYTLFQLGEFDDNKCLFALHETPMPLMKAVEAKGTLL